jgi:uncharacterized membrane protein SpoIIM required for sporulation
LSWVLDLLEIIVGKRWRLLTAIFLIEMAFILIISNAPFLPGELSTYKDQYNNIKPVLGQDAAAQIVSIFANNFRVALVEIVPLIGPAVFGFSIYETARIVEVIGLQNPVGIIGSLVTLFALPSTWLELPAYSIAVVESLYLAYAIFTGFRGGWTRLARELRFFVVNILLIAGVLLVAAAFEVSEIQLESSPQPALAFLTWIPFVLVAVGVVRFWRRARVDAPALEERDASEAASRAGGQATGFAGDRQVIEPGRDVIYCPSCGKAVIGRPAFCPWCGKPIVV